MNAGLKGVLILLAIGTVLVVLLAPAIQSAREAARMNTCNCHMKGLGLALHNHNDTRNGLPLASTEPLTGIPGKVGGPNPAGYSFLVAVLPYLEETGLYDDIAATSQQFTLSPLADEVRRASGNHASIMDKPLLEDHAHPRDPWVCPSYALDIRVDVTNSTYRSYTGGPDAGPPLISNVVALVSSHFTNSTGPGTLSIKGQFAGDGAIVFPVTGGASFHAGLPLNSITDGTSKTIISCETREPSFSAWIDGQATWVVGDWPANPNVPTAMGAPDGYLGWPAGSANFASIQRGSDDPASPDIYMPASRWSANMPRRWGPGSYHAGGVVIHLFADGHVTGIRPDIDPTVYIRIISRAGGEPVDADVF